MPSTVLATCVHCGHCKATLKVCVNLDANPKLSHFINPQKYLKNMEILKSAALSVPGIFDKGISALYSIVGSVINDEVMMDGVF